MKPARTSVGRGPGIPGICLGCVVWGLGAARAEEKPPPPLTLPAVPAAQTAGKPLPINLPTALQLANVRPIDVAVAGQRVEAAVAAYDRAKVLWLPTLYAGVDYARQDGQIQDIVGQVFSTSRSSLMVGGGPSAVFATTDAIFSPLATRQVVGARLAEVQATKNDTLLAVAETYFNVQQARGDLSGAIDAHRRAEDLVRRTEKLTPGLAPAVEVNRARTELARRAQAVEAAYERWQTQSAELNRLLRLEPTAIVEPLEPPHLRVDLIDLDQPVDDLVLVGLRLRPELAAHQALVEATISRLRQEKLRPLIPSVLIRGNATNPAGTLSGGYFGGGVNDDLTNFDGRHSLDVQVLWELQNLGLGNRAAVRERQAENQLAVLQLMRTQDRVATEVTQAHAQARRAVSRLRAAEAELLNAIETAEKNLEGLGQTRRAGEVLVLVFRPQEVVTAIQALEQAYRDFFGAVADANRAQFRLYRALGHPAQCVLGPETDPTTDPAACPPHPPAQTPSPAPTPRGP